MSVRGLLPILVQRPEMARLRERLARAPKTGTPATPLAFALSGVADAAKPYLAAAIAVAAQRPVLLVTTDEARARSQTQALASILGDRPDTDAPQAMLLPDRAAMPYERLLSDAETMRERVSALLAIIEARARRRDGNTEDEEKRRNNTEHGKNGTSTHSSTSETPSVSSEDFRDLRVPSPSLVI